MAVQVLKIKEDMQAVLACGVIGDFSEYNKDKDHKIEQITINDFQNVLNRLDKDKPVTLLLDSYGGSLLDAQQLVQVMKNYQKSGGIINVTVPYIAASCATLIALSGNNLTYDPEGLFLIHSVYYDPKVLKTVTKLDESTLNKLKEEISELNDGLAKFYSEKSTTDVKVFRKLIAKAQDLVLSPQEMKETYGFKLDIDNLFNEDGYLKLTLNKLDREISVNDQSLKEKIEQAAILGYCKDFNLTNITIQDSLTNLTNLSTNNNNNHNLSVNNNMAKTNNLPTEQEIKDPTDLNPVDKSENKPENPTNEENKVEFKITITEEELKAKYEKAEIEAKAKIAEKNKKVYELFEPYLGDADYRREYQACLSGMYEFEDCQKRFYNLKMEKDKDTFKPANLHKTVCNFTNIDDVVYALCLKNGVNIREEDPKKRYLNYSSMDRNLIKIRDKSVDEVLLAYANSKLARLGREPIDFSECYNSIEKSDLLFNAITQADLNKILSTFAKEIWIESDIYPDLTNILKMLDFVQINDMNTVRLFKNTTPLQESGKIPENGEYKRLKVSADYVEFKAEKFGIQMDATFETLLNDKFELFKKAFKTLIASLQYGFKKEFIINLLNKRNRDQYKQVKSETNITKALNKVRSVYNGMVDINKNPIVVRPDFIYTGPELGQLIENFLNCPTDFDQANPNKPNPWYGGKIYDLELLSDVQLVALAEQTLPKNEKDKINDAYFIPKGAIKYLAFNMNITPNIITIQNPASQSQSICGLTIYGIAFIDPEYIVQLDGKSLLDALN